MYKITKTNKTIFGDEKFSTNYRGFRAKSTETEEESKSRFERLKKKCNKRFRVLDDDGEIYFWGYSTTNNDERAFQPLDEIGIDYGCTIIEYYNSETKMWEEL